MNNSLYRLSVSTWIPACMGKLRLHLTLICLVFIACSAFASDVPKKNEGLPKLGPEVIQSYDYDGKRREFLVRLTDGERLLVSGIPEQVYREFNASDHKVPYYNRIIRPNYRGKRLPPKPRSLSAGVGQNAKPSGACTRGLLFRALNP